MGLPREIQYRIAAFSVAVLMFDQSHVLADTGDQVSLRFSWPDKLVLQVDRQFMRTETRPDGSPPPTTNAVRYLWRGAKEGPNYRVTFDRFEIVQPEPRPEFSDLLVQLEYVSRQVEPLLATIIVDSAGQPVDLRGIRELRMQIEAEYKAIPGISEDPAGRRILEVLISDQMLIQRSVEDWNQMIEVWHSVDADVGDSGRIQVPYGEAEIPGGVALEKSIIFALESWVPCAKSDVQKSCLRLVTRVTPIVVSMGRRRYVHCSASTRLACWVHRPQH